MKPNLMSQMDEQMKKYYLVKSEELLLDEVYKQKSELILLCASEASSKHRILPAPLQNAQCYHDTTSKNSHM